MEKLHARLKEEEGGQIYLTEAWKYDVYRQEYKVAS